MPLSILAFYLPIYRTSISNNFDSAFSFGGWTTNQKMPVHIKEQLCWYRGGELMVMKISKSPLYVNMDQFQMRHFFNASCT
jgi:hypothetical protein